MAIRMDADFGDGDYTGPVEENPKRILAAAVRDKPEFEPGKMEPLNLHCVQN